MSALSLIVAALLAGLAGGGTLGWLANDWRRDSIELEASRDAAQHARDQAKRLDRAAESFQAGQEAARAHDEAMQPEVIRVITKLVYLERCLDDDGMRILSADIAAANARRGLAPAVPASATTR